MGRIPAKPATDGRVERHDAHFAAIAFQRALHRIAERPNQHAARFRFDQERNLATHQAKNLGQPGDSLVRAPEQYPVKFGGRAGIEISGFACQAVESPVVKDKSASVARAPNVEFDAVALCDRGCESCPAILDHAAAVQASMGKAPVREK